MYFVNKNFTQGILCLEGFIWYNFFWKMWRNCGFMGDYTHLIEATNLNTSWLSLLKLTWYNQRRNYKLHKWSRVWRNITKNVIFLCLHFLFFIYENTWKFSLNGYQKEIKINFYHEAMFTIFLATRLEITS